MKKYVGALGVQSIKEWAAGKFASLTHSHDVATAGNDGYMSAEDKVKLDGLEDTLADMGDEISADLASSSVLYHNNVGELEDVKVRTGTFTNAGAGWNTFTFPESFDEVPVIACNCDGYTVEVKSVTTEQFLYRVVEGASGASLSTTTTTLYRNSKPSSTYRYVMALSYTNYTSAFNVLTGATLSGGGEAATVSDAVEIRWAAIEYAGE